MNKLHIIQNYNKRLITGTPVIKVDPINPLPDTEDINPKQAFGNDWEPTTKEPKVPTWKEFTQSTTFHGIKYIFGHHKESKFRR